MGLKRTPLKRKTSLRSKRPTARRVAPAGGCASRGCKATHVRVVVSSTEKFCDKHATARADDLCRAFTKQRDPTCVACGEGSKGVQWAHLHTRGMRHVRWDAENSVGLCQGCHYAYTKSPSRWVKFVERTWPGRWTRVLHRELEGDRLGYSVDVAEVIRSYRAGLPWHAPEPGPGSPYFVGAAGSGAGEV